MNHFEAEGVKEAKIGNYLTVEPDTENENSGGMNTEAEIDSLAELVWDYHHMHQPLEKADAIFVLGSHDLGVAAYAADLFLEGYAPYMIFSGGSPHNGDHLHVGWNTSEAEMMAEVALQKGVPADAILLEKQATNTGENIAFTRDLLKKKGLTPQSFILVQKPYMERRTYATFMKQWPGQKCIVTSAPGSFKEYVAGGIPKEAALNIMVGDLQRIKEYPARGFQIEQEIPDDVWNAFERLVSLGFNKRLIP